MVAALPLPPRRLHPLDGIPLRPQARRFGVRVVDALTRVLQPRRSRRPRLLALFIDGVAPEVLAAAAREGTAPFLGSLRDARGMHETRAFSGMPSSTAPFQAGLFYGLRHPDVPGFSFYDRAGAKRIHMETPSHAAAVEARLRSPSPGLLEGGAGYLSILRGGSPTHFSTAAAAALLDRSELPRPAKPAAMAIVHPMSLLRVLARMAMEGGVLARQAVAHVARTGSLAHERNFLLNRLMIGTLTREVALGEIMIDLVSGVPRVFLTLHDYDEASHRRGPVAARQALRSIDAAAELLCAVAAALPDPPDVWVFTDHGQIEAVPFEKLMGMNLAAWLRGAAEGPHPPPGVPSAVATALGGTEGLSGLSPPPRVVDAGNFAHVYLGKARPIAGREILERHGRTLARALACPAVGLTAMRTDDGAIAFAGGRMVDPADPRTVPKGASPRAVAAMLDDLAHSPSAGDLVLYGAWFPSACVSFEWEFSSHGGVSPAETETFVIHPEGVPVDVGKVSHGADLHDIFRSLYGDEAHDDTRDRRPAPASPSPG